MEESLRNVIQSLPEPYRAVVVNDMGESADETEGLARLRAWLETGAHGDMLWMAETESRRGSPAGLWPEVRSIVSLGMTPPVAARNPRPVNAVSARVVRASPTT